MTLSSLFPVLWWSLFTTSFVLLTYTYLGYPILTAVLGRFARRRHETGGLEPSVSFIILAHNEERGIARKLENTLVLDYPKDKLEIVVASDGSTDRTDEIVKSFSASGVRLFRAKEHPGKTETTNQVVTTTRGEILVFSDASGSFRPDALRMLVRNFADPKVGGVVGRVTYRYGGSTTSRGFRGYQRYVVPVRRAESLTGTATTASGSICAVRRELFRAAPPELDFDMVHPLHVAHAGSRMVYEPEAISEEESRERIGDEFRARVRMAVQHFAFIPYLLGRLPSCRNRVYAFQVLSMKVLRWVSPIILLVLLFSSLALASGSQLAAVVLMILLVVILAAALGYVAERHGRHPRLLALPLFYITMNLAFLAGFARWMRGDRMRAWTPER